MLIPIQVTRKSNQTEEELIDDIKVQLDNVLKALYLFEQLQNRVTALEENTLYNRFKWWLMYG